MPELSRRTCLARFGILAYMAKRERPPVDKTLGENIRALIGIKAMGIESEPQLAKAAKVDQRTVNRIVKGEVMARVNTLERIADALGVEPYQLLIPGLNAKNPQILKSLSPEEENFYKALEALDLARAGPPKKGTQ